MCPNIRTFGYIDMQKKVRHHLKMMSYFLSAKRDSNSRPSPWQGDALPLSHSRRSVPFLRDKMYYNNNIGLGQDFILKSYILLRTLNVKATYNWN